MSMYHRTRAPDDPLEGDGRDTMEGLERVLREGSLRLNEAKTGVFRVGARLGIDLEARREGGGGGWGSGPLRRLRGAPPRRVSDNS